MKKWIIPATAVVVVSFFLVPAASADDRGLYRAQGAAIGFASAMVLDHFLDDHNRGSSAVHIDYRYEERGYGRGYSDFGIRYDYRDRYRYGDRQEYRHKMKHKKAKAYRKGYRKGYRNGLGYGPPGLRYGGDYRHGDRWNFYGRRDRRCR